MRMNWETWWCELQNDMFSAPHFFPLDYARTFFLYLRRGFCRILRWNCKFARIQTSHHWCNLLIVLTSSLHSIRYQKCLAMQGKPQNWMIQNLWWGIFRRAKSFPKRTKYWTTQALLARVSFPFSYYFTQKIFAWHSVQCALRKGSTNQNENNHIVLWLSTQCYFLVVLSSNITLKIKISPLVTDA